MFSRLLGLLQARQVSSASIPSVCYSDCETAFEAAQYLGKTPELCDNNSTFFQGYDTCDGCVAVNGQPDTQQYIASVFSPFLAYCATSATLSLAPTDASTASQVTIPPSYLTVIPTLTPAFGAFSQLSGGFKTMSVWINVNITSTLPAYYTHLSIDALISSYIPPDVLSELAASVSAAAAAASVTGNPTSLIYSALEGASPPPWFASAVPATYAPQMSTLEADINALLATTGAGAGAGTSTGGTEASGSPSSSKAWIAGVVVGVVAGIALLLTGGFLLRRHRRRRLHRGIHEADGEASESKYAKHQLHGDSVPVPAPNPVFEMDSGEPPPRELPATENPQELHDHRGDAHDREANTPS